MRPFHLALLFILAAVLLLESAAQKPHKSKQLRNGKRRLLRTSTTTTTEVPLDPGQDGEEDAAAALANADSGESSPAEQEEADSNGNTDLTAAEVGDLIDRLNIQIDPSENEIDDADVEISQAKEIRRQEAEHDSLSKLDMPCANIKCGAGRQCVIVNEKASCECIQDCPVEEDPRRKVCSNHNETWDSDCLLYQMRCFCSDENAEQNSLCKSVDYKHVHVEYFGECKEIEECTAEEMSDFPRRMRDWLFNVMRDLADRNELSKHYLSLEREAEKKEDLGVKWMNSAIWKWCDLDAHPHDRRVSRHELFPIRAPLLSLEHCIAPFLDSCDIDNDHFITLKEWGTCLLLEKDEIDEKCEEIQ